MPAFISTPSFDVLPLWDSFEAVFFVISGITVGFVLGLLFPSVWRTLRRRFSRSSKPYEIPGDVDGENLLPINLKSIAEAFVLARNSFQEKEFRNSVKIYIDILTSDKASKKQINRALFEIAQVYFELALYTKAFDTIFELLNRKQQDTESLHFILKILKHIADDDKFLKVYHHFKGIADPNSRQRIAHTFCLYAEQKLKQDKISHAIEWAHKALRFNRRSAHGLFVLWVAKNHELRKNKHFNTKAKWVAFAADLDTWVQICADTGVSSCAGAEQISLLMTELIEEDPTFEHFKLVQNEFKKVIDFEKMSVEFQKIFLESIFYAIILIREREKLIDKQSRFPILTMICDNQQILQRILSFINYDHFSYLKRGLIAHQCQNCRAFFPRFIWACYTCEGDTLLQPCESPFAELFLNVDSNRDTHKNHSN